MDINLKTTLKIIFLFLFLAFAPICTTRIAIGPAVKSFGIPLIAKISAFLEREYTFRFLVKDIIRGKIDAEDKILEVYNWVRKNIKDMPRDWNNRDDHELNIIVRGYATDTDKVRIFCILTTFAGYPGQEYQANLMYNNAFVAGRAAGVRLGNRWLYLDLINDVYFRLDGHIASIDEIKNSPEKLVPNRDILIEPVIFYKSCQNLREIKNIKYVRGHLQMVIPRIKYILEQKEVSNLY